MKDSEKIRKIGYPDEETKRRLMKTNHQKIFTIESMKQAREQVEKIRALRDHICRSKADKRDDAEEVDEADQLNEEVKKILF